MPKHLARVLEGAPPAFTRTERAGRVTLLAVVAGAIALSLPVAGSSWTDPANAALVILGAAYLAVFLTLGQHAETSSRWGLVHGYFALQLAIAAALFAVPASRGSFGMTWLVLMPLVAHAVLLLRWWGVAVVAGASVALVVAHAAWVGGARIAVQAGMGALVATAFVVLFANVARLEVLARERSDRLRRELAEAHRRLGEYAVQASELAASRERNRLAREIHDSLGHHLTVVSVQLEAAELVLERDPDDARERIRRARGLAREGLAEVRRSVAALRASPLDGRPLPEAIARLAASDTDPPVGFEVLGEARSLDEAEALTLYRAAQEGLTNVRRHARASRVAVTLDYRAPAAVRLTVADDGVGTAGEPGGSGGAFGLLGLRERAAVVDGRVDVRSTPGAGFTLVVEVPG